jgi:hypothetical protein
VISWVCCKARDDRFERHLGPSLEVQRERYGAELVLVSHPSSIFAAYEEGRRRASHELVAYVHEDVEVLDPFASEKIARAFSERPRAGLVGLCGSRERELLPWWHNRGARVGHWVERGRGGVLLYFWSTGRRFAREPIPEGGTWRAWEARAAARSFRGVEGAGLLDGLLLAEHRGRLDLPWDTQTYSGWHAYDADRCLQAHAAGLEVLAVDVLAGHFESPHGAGWAQDASRSFAAARRKWGLRRSRRHRLLRHPWS